MPRRFPILCFLALTGILRTLCAADTSEQFLGAYQAYQQGEKAERAGSTGDALKNYRYAESLLQEIAAKDPSWQKAVVEYRLKKTREGLSRLQGSDGLASASPVPDADHADAPSEAEPAVQPRTTPSITITAPSSQNPRQSVSSASTGETARLRKLVASLKSELQSVRDATASERSRSDDLDKMQWTKERSQLEQQLADARDQITSLGEKLRKRDSWEKDIKDLQKRLDDALADKASAEEYYQQRERKLAEAAAGLGRQLEDARSRITAGNESVRKVAELTARVEQGREALKQLQARLDRAGDASKADLAVVEEERGRLLAEVKRLGDSTQGAARAKVLESEAAELKKTVASLRQQLEAAVKESTRTKALAARSELEAKEAGRKNLTVVSGLEADRAVIEEERGVLEARLVQAAGRLSELQGQLSARAAGERDEKKRFAESESARVALEASLRQREQELSTAREEAGRLKGDLESSNRKAAEFEQQVRLGQDRLKQLQDQLSDLSSKASPGNAANESLRKEIEKLRAEADASRDKIASLQGDSDKGKELQRLLAEKESELSRLKKKKGAKGDVADAKTAEENAVLRSIILRQVKEEARRAQARRLMEEEMKRLNVQSRTLSDQIGILAAPAMVLSPEERALFKEDQLVVIDDGSGSLQASVSAPLSRPQAPSEGSQDGNPANVPGPSAATSNPSQEGSGEIAWQGKFKECLARAKEEFDRQDYLQAENSFKEAISYSPDDYFALSNLGVVEFQLGKLKEAEEALTKASGKKTDSSFALTTLGIVHYRQNRLEDAEKTLRKAIALNDQDFTAHNYLGIVLAAGGKGKAGESEIMKALELNKNYADAHFNLAVIYATGKPPSKMMAKKHYAKALELGAPPDPSLERLVQ
jgi:tetratricopeptide (TPR) repeat protein